MTRTPPPLPAEVTQLIYSPVIYSVAYKILGGGSPSCQLSSPCFQKSVFPFAPRAPDRKHVLWLLPWLSARGLWPACDHRFGPTAKERRLVFHFRRPSASRDSAGRRMAMVCSWTRVTAANPLRHGHGIHSRQSPPRRRVCRLAIRKVRPVLREVAAFVNPRPPLHFFCPTLSQAGRRPAKGLSGNFINLFDLPFGSKSMGARPSCPLWPVGPRLVCARRSRCSKASGQAVERGRESRPPSPRHRACSMKPHVPGQPAVPEAVRTERAGKPNARLLDPRRLVPLNGGSITDLRHDR